LKILVLGGTKFVGRHLVEAAIARGHTLTLFHRGQTNPGLFPGVEVVTGDREHDLDRLAGRRWDAVIDTCGYVPRVVGMAARALAEAVDRYVFISSISVYGTEVAPGADEATPLLSLDDPSVEVVDGRTYGPLKALCEAELEAILPGRVLNVRPGLIVGPEDPTDRFTYWPHRLAQGGEVLAPGDSRQPVQFIDVRDLAEWIVRAVEDGLVGPFNATGPHDPLTMEDFLTGSREALASDARVTWVDEAFLLAQGVRPFTDLPLWMPRASAGFSAISSRKAQRAGLRYRSLAQTVRDTEAWARGQAWEGRKAGLSPDREREVLAAWDEAKTKQGV